MLRETANSLLSAKRATILSFVLLALAVWGDIITTGETAFTLCYLVPQALAVWYVSLRVGYVVVALSALSGLYVDVIVGPRVLHWQAIAWNQLVEFGLYLVFIHVLAALKARFTVEAQLRMQALDQLRHAERLTTIGKLASGIAHEIGTPLNVISGHAELMLAGRIGPEDIKQEGKILLEQSERVSTIVRQLLDFARRGGTRAVLTDMNELVVSTSRLLSSLARKSNIDLIAQGSVTETVVNRSEIQQVLTNLITNAIQAMPKGGKVVIDVREEHTRPPDMKGGPARDYVVLSVRDAGVGIAHEILPQIFDPFFTTKDIGYGTGLGLSVTYGIVKDHGGWIAVDTRLGEGTTFSVYLPKIERSAASSVGN